MSSNQQSVQDDVAILRNYVFDGIGNAALDRLIEQLEACQRLVVAHHAAGALDGILPGDRCPVCAASDPTSQSETFRTLAGAMAPHYAMPKTSIDWKAPNPASEPEGS